MLKATGGIDGTLDFRLLYHLHPTALVLAGRTTQVLLSLAGVVGTWLLGCRLGGRATGAVAALAVALSPVLVERAQMIEVDGPLFTFAAFALWAALRLFDGTTTRRVVVAGILVGLAASTKYPGVLLLVPVTAALFLAPRPAGRLPWRAMVLAGAVAAVVFTVTSPYVFLDWETFRGDLALEQDHVSQGHFGQDAAPTPVAYLTLLGSRLLGLPGLLLALAGMVWLGGFRRDRRVWVLALFLAAYFLLLAVVSMRAERYALPLLPALFVLAAAAATRLAARVPAPSARIAVPAAAALLLVLGPASGWTAWKERLRGSNRTLAKVWIEKNYPAGSMVASELYGPDLFGPLQFLPMEPEMRDRIVSERERFPLFALQQVPMFQVTPERSANFYDLDLYVNADLFVTSSQVRGRYEAEPSRFAFQLAFYDSLETHYREVKRFGKEDGSGPEIVIYENPENEVPFGDRNTVYFPRKIDVQRTGMVSGEELFFYYNLGLLYETFGHIDAALTAYGMGLQFPGQRPEVLVNTVFAACRQFVRTGQMEEAQKAVDWALKQPGLGTAQLAELRRLQGMVNPAPPASGTP